MSTAATTTSVVGVIGLGIMGGAMAEALLKAGYRVNGHDVSAAATGRLAESGGEVLADAGKVAEASDIVIISLSTSASLAATAGLLAMTAASRNPVRPLIVLETSTLPMQDKLQAQQLLRAAGVELLDCPISGTAVRMKERAWTVFCSGSAQAFETVRPMLQVFTDNTPYVGVFGNGTKMKFAANHLVAIYNVACAESVNFARKMGLDPQQVLDLFGNSPVIGTGVMRLRVPFMIRHEYEPATMRVEVWQKDMQVIGEMADAVDCATPLFSACVPVYSAAMAQGHAQHDTASVSEVLARLGSAGVSPA